VISYNTIVVLVGVGLLGAGAGVVGSFAVLRRRALLGDALSHAALPGLCIGFLIAGDRHLPAMLLGALATGLLGVWVVSAITHRTRVRQDAAIGIVLSVFFGAGIVLSRLIQNSTTVAGSKAGLDSYILGKTAGMVASDVLLIGGTAAGAVGLVTVLFKEFLLVSFDPGFARVQGWPARWIDLGLTGLVAAVVVIGLPAVGVVMMAALLITPGVSARFWSDRLSRVVVLAALFGVGMGLVGTAISATYNKMPAGPIITLVGTAVFVASALAAPRRGLVARVLARRHDRERADADELLRLVYEAAESGREFDELVRTKAWPPARVRHLVNAAIRAGNVTDGPALTPKGEGKAAEVVRRDRLWRLLVADYPDFVALARPLTGEPVEESIPADVVTDLVAKLKAAGRWPDAEPVAEVVQ
jgi:manganese/zinc/iron transport system permease protein